MKKWILVISLLLVSVAVILWAISPLFITYAQVLPTDVIFEAENKESVANAIIQEKHRAIESLRNIYGDSMLGLSLIAILNAFVASYFIFKSENKYLTSRSSFGRSKLLRLAKRYIGRYISRNMYL